MWVLLYLSATFSGFAAYPTHVAYFETAVQCQAERDRMNVNQRYICAPAKLNKED